MGGETEGERGTRGKGAQREPSHEEKTSEEGKLRLRQTFNSGERSAEPEEVAGVAFLLVLDRRVGLNELRLNRFARPNFLVVLIVSFLVVLRSK